MRRGPKLHFEPLALGTGFGINATTGVPAGGKAIKGSTKAGDSDIELQPKFDSSGGADNVMDYANSSMLSFIFLAYVSRSRQVREQS